MTWTNIYVSMSFEIKYYWVEKNAGFKTSKKSALPQNNLFDNTNIALLIMHDVIEHLLFQNFERSWREPDLRSIETPSSPASISPGPDRKFAKFTFQNFF